MSSAICFNLDQSKILSSGNGLITAVSGLRFKFHVDSNKVDLISVYTIQNLYKALIVLDKIFLTKKVFFSSVRLHVCYDKTLENTGHVRVF